MVLILGVLGGWVVLAILLGLSLARSIALRERQPARRGLEAGCAGASTACGAQYQPAA